MEPTNDHLLDATPDSELDEWARHNGWLILETDKAYLQQVFERGYLVLHKINAKWWLEYTTKTQGKMQVQEKSTVKVKNVSLERAQDEATRFIDWAKKQRRSWERKTAAAEAAKPRRKKT